MNKQQLRPPPRVTSNPNAFPAANGPPPPRTDYLQLRHESESEPLNLFDPKSPPRRSQPTAHPPPSQPQQQTQQQQPPASVGKGGDFDADVQREMMKLEAELRKQLENEETLTQLDRQYSQYPGDFTPDLSQLNPNFIPDLSQLNPNFIPDLSQLNPNFIPDLSQLNPNSTPDLSQLNPNLHPGPVKT